MFIILTSVFSVFIAFAINYQSRSFQDIYHKSGHVYMSRTCLSCPQVLILHFALRHIYDVYNKNI
jgi:hypothetical protein